MAPQKKPQQKKSGAKSAPKPDTKSAAPKLQISAENERRLRRLLLNNTATSSSSAAATPSSAPDTASRSQKAKRLRGVYDNLSLQGFTPDQIELALSALNEGATFEAALDWLCLNLPGNELPMKFSTGLTSSAPEERSVKVIPTARADRIPPQRSQQEVIEEKPPVAVRIKGKRDELSLDFDKSSQADWIRQYMEQQAEEEEDELNTQEEAWDQDPSLRAASIAEEYHRARVGAQEAKQKKNKKNQQYFGEIIQKLKQEMSSLGLSDDILVSRSLDEYTSLTSDEMQCESKGCTPFESMTSDGAVSWEEFDSTENKTKGIAPNDEKSDENDSKDIKDLNIPDNGDGEKKEEPELELDNLFCEDASIGLLPPDLLKQQKKEKVTQLAFGHIKLNIDEIWKKGDMVTIPKASLQKICQRLGWEAPKYNKLVGEENKFLYSVSILRTATGRGKSRKAGGLITLQLPDQEEGFESVEVAQNKIAAFALYQLFPDLPLNQMLKEPYASFIGNWQEDEFPTKLEDRENTRRAGFVDSLLDSDTCHPVVSLDVGGKHPEPYGVETVHDSYTAKSKGLNNHERTESTFLKKELEEKKKLPKYMDMLETRASLPIAKLKSSILQMLVENDVIVVCGETGCGKTTQVPQFILDDMIESGYGGRCNIVCTQPRRIAAISVAERVSNERCEFPPGSDGSLVGFQVRLDSARNEKTKLLFCTTGILLRKLVGNKDLAGITHVIVDEVHERSLLGDFLLIVLKNLIKRQSSFGGQKLKVILMSATVDSGLFSKYFGHCPVISAEGRTYPVSTCFLEDIYENLNYSLPSDSPASGKSMMPRSMKPGSKSVDNHRGKKNLILSGWGDESVLLDGYVNPFYNADCYESYSERTHQNLKSLIEDVIDFDLLEDLICYIDDNHPPGAILVFLPGVAEIDMLVDKLTASFRFGGVSADWVLPLHSSLASADQRKVFLSPPQNMRKVIVSTDIAETSITIDDVVYVIDTGKHKENRFNPQKKMSSMVEDWISQANVKQRRGRAGRVKPGMCFCLYTRHRFEKLMRPFQVPEMLRMPLTELCLHIKSLSLGDIKSILTTAIEPPREEAISSAIDLLYKVGAFEGDEVLSSLGYHLAKLPVDVLIGKMMLYGAIFGCLSPILSIAAFLSYKLPFLYPKDEKQNVDRAKSTLLNDNQDAETASSEANKQSDHVLLVVAYSRWAKILHGNGAKAAQKFCRSFFLNSSVMNMVRDMRVQFGSLLADIGLVNLPIFFKSDEKRKDQLDSWFSDMSQPFNMYANHPSIIKSVLCAGLYPNIAATIESTVGNQGSNKALCSNLSTVDHPVWFDGRREVHIHPSSINHNTRVFHYPFLVFLEKVETSKIFLRDTSVISPYSILLFGGSIVVQHQTGAVIIDNWLKLTAPAQTAVLFKELRITLQAVLKDLIRKPEISTIANNEVVQSIIHLLLEEDKAHFS